MANKLRVFISSTMEDLQNERQAVVERLHSLGMEPVHAETFSPTGETSWAVIEQEIRDCHLFVLILGKSYGWQPDAGHGGGGEKSVTHLEFELARQLNVPVLSFMKRLSYGTPVDARRDAFRREVSDWAAGLFRVEFDWAADLSEKVVSAVVSLGMQSVLKDLVRQRDQVVSRQSLVTAAVAPTLVASCLPEGASPRQRDATALNDEWVLVAGAGLSVAAGYPTASFIVTSLVKRLWSDVSADAIFGRYSFDEVAGYYEYKHGRQALLKAIGELLDTPQRILPTVAHFEAVKKFGTIITTNYDELFEMACLATRIPYVVMTSSQTLPSQSGKVSIIKLSGTISEPSSLRLTSADLKEVMGHSKYFGAVCDSLSGRRVAVVGHSLRDAHLVKALEESQRSGPGVYVRPDIGVADDILLERFRLAAVSQRADEFLTRFNQ